MEINIDELFEVVIEPGHSKMVLKEFEDKYGFDSIELYQLYKQGLIDYQDLEITKKEFNSWIHHFIVFKENGGDPWELNNDHIREEEEFKNSSFFIEYGF